MLPVSQYQANENAAAAYATGRPERRILVVDDDETIRNMFECFLE